MNIYNFIYGYTLTNQNPIRTYKAGIGASAESTVSKTLTSEVKKKTFTVTLIDCFLWRSQYSRLIVGSQILLFPNPTSGSIEIDFGKRAG